MKVKKLWSALALILFMSLACAEEKTGKDELFNEYFDIDLIKPGFIKGDEGCLNYTSILTCLNGSGLYGTQIAPYEVVDYILAVDNNGVVEKIGKTQFVYLPGGCREVVNGRFCGVTQATKNISLIHMFKPQHSRVPAKEYDVHKRTGNVTALGFNFGVILKPIEAFMENTVALSVTAFGIILFMVAIPLHLMHKRRYSLPSFIVSILIMFMGLLLGAA